MSESRAWAGGGDAAADVSRVEVTIPADAARLPLLRSIAAALAVMLDFDIDTMADMRMAVDELGSTMVTRARPGSTVRVEFLADRDTVSVRAVASAADPAPIDEASFGWMVLNTLSRSVSGAVEDQDGSGPQVRLSLVVGPSQDGR